MVDEAKFVSSCFSLPSKARPRLSLLFASNGVNEYTLLRFEHGVNGNPSLKAKNAESHARKEIFVPRFEQGDIAFVLRRSVKTDLSILYH